MITMRKTIVKVDYSIQSSRRIFIRSFQLFIECEQRHSLLNGHVEITGIIQRETITFRCLECVPEIDMIFGNLQAQELFEKRGRERW